MHIINNKYSFVSGLTLFIAVPVQSTCGNTKRADDEYSELGSLSPEVSAIYLAMQHSKLECIDEQSQDSISTDGGCADPDETEELDEFDPYTFIKDLPELSMVVPKFRPVLLPKQTRSCPRTTLVLDLDGKMIVWVNILSLIFALESWRNILME